MDIPHRVGEFAPQGVLVCSGGVGEPEGQGRNPRSLPSSFRYIQIGGWSALNESVQSRLGDGEAIDELQTDPIDGFDQIVVVNVPPLVTGKQIASR